MTVDALKAPGEVYYPGDEVFCAVEGNPPPAITWVDPENNNDTVSTSGTLTIDQDMIGLQTYSCLAKNTVRGVDKFAMATFTFNITGRWQLLLHNCIFWPKCAHALSWGGGVSPTFLSPKRLCVWRSETGSVENRT